jgi:hypothetical protein
MSVEDADSGGVIGSTGTSALGILGLNCCDWGLGDLGGDRISDEELAVGDKDRDWVLDGGGADCRRSEVFA